jgi:hypothetical protein
LGIILCLSKLVNPTKEGKVTGKRSREKEDAAMSGEWIPVMSVPCLVLSLFSLFSWARGTSKQFSWEEAWETRRRHITWRIVASVVSVLAVVSLFASFLIGWQIDTERKTASVGRFTRVNNYRLLAYNDETSEIDQPFAAAMWQQKAIMAALSVTTTSAVEPITDNPKVRNLIYVVEVEIDPAYYFYEGRVKKTTADAVKKIESCLYEFNNQYSRELGEFYNPHDDVQLEQLSKIVTSYLNQPHHLGPFLRALQVSSFEVSPLSNLGLPTKAES